MKVGKEISSPKTLNTNIISSVGSRLRLRQYGFFKAVFLGGILLNILLLPINVSLNLTQAVAVGNTVSPWWPANNSHIAGSQPSKAAVDGLEPRDSRKDGGGL